MGVSGQTGSRRSRVGCGSEWTAKVMVKESGLWSRWTAKIRGTKHGFLEWIVRVDCGSESGL